MCHHRVRDDVPLRGDEVKERGGIVDRAGQESHRAQQQVRLTLDPWQPVEQRACRFAAGNGPTQRLIRRRHAVQLVHGHPQIQLSRIPPHASPVSHTITIGRPRRWEDMPPSREVFASGSACEDHRPGGPRHSVSRTEPRRPATRTPRPRTSPLPSVGTGTNGQTQPPDTAAASPTRFPYIDRPTTPKLGSNASGHRSGYGTARVDDMRPDLLGGRAWLAAHRG